MHMAGVSTIQAGNPTAGQQLLQSAAGLLKGVPTSTHTASPTMGPATEAAPPFATSRSGAAAASALTRAAVTLHVPITRDIGALDPIAKMSVQSISFRVAGREDGWGTLPVLTPQLRSEQSKAWSVGVPAGTGIPTFTVASGKLASADEIVAKIYKSRVSAVDLTALYIPIVDTSSTTFYLTHLYAYVLPVKLGDTLP